MRRNFMGAADDIYQTDAEENKSVLTSISDAFAGITNAFSSAWNVVDTNKANDGVVQGGGGGVSPSAGGGGLVSPPGAPQSNTVKYVLIGAGALAIFWFIKNGKKGRKRRR